jgi:hypothetical protein
MSDRPTDPDVARRLAERLLAPATGGNTRPLRTEAGETILALAARLEAAERERDALREALELLFDAVEDGDGLSVVNALEHARAALAASEAAQTREQP